MLQLSVCVFDKLCSIGAHMLQICVYGCDNLLQHIWTCYSLVFVVLTTCAAYVNVDMLTIEIAA